MTLRDEILARQDCADAVAARDLDAIAALMSAGRTRRKLVQIADNVDMSIPLVDQSFAALVSVGLLPAATYDEIVGMSYEADPVSRFDVADALYNDDGSMK
jgi:hypothetical protein